MIIPFSPACERNKDVILESVDAYMRAANSVLEIGSGTAQHAVHFALNYPELIWQTSDCQQYLEGINAQIEHKKAQSGVLKNLIEPVELDVNQAPWFSAQNHFDLIYTANTLHIMSQPSVGAFFAGLPAVSHSGSILIIYGPFKYSGKFTSESNRQFDQSLRSRGVGSEIKEFTVIAKLAEQAGYGLLEDIAMPANNQCLIWRRN